MMADMQMNVWLDTLRGAGAPVVVPYVQTDQDAQLRWRMSVVKKGASGQSRIHQSGTLVAAAGRPQEMSRMSVAVAPGDECAIEIEMLERGQVRGRYRFDCPR